MWQLANHLQDAVLAGSARKAAKREPTSSPGGMMDVSAAQSGSGASGAAGGECQLAALTCRRGWVGALAAGEAGAVLGGENGRDEPRVSLCGPRTT